MKKLLLITVFALVLILSACNQTVDVVCGEGTVQVGDKCEVEITSCDTGYHIEDNECVADEVTCDAGYHLEEGSCVEDAVTCETGYHEEDGECVVDEVTCDAGYHEEDGECVLDAVVESPEWFAGWSLLMEPVGDKSLSDLVFTETGFSVYLGINNRVGIQMLNVTFDPGYMYEVTFDYSSSVAGKGIFVQLQGHGGYVFTNPGLITTESTETFSQILAYPPTAPGTTEGWLTIELTPSGVAGEVTIDNIEIIKTALPTCGENEVLKGTECIPSNNGFLPNGTPTAWFDGWEILTIPAGNKEISDLDFTETGYTMYLAEGERSGIQLLGYVFESGYTYELTFDYTASVAGRLVWVQMEALGGYGFTNTDTWTVAGTATFSQTLVIPDTYTPVEPGWIKLELAPGGQDNITIDNIQIIKTAN